MKAITFLFLMVYSLVLSSLPIDVMVTCSNGGTVSFLPITVKDKNGNILPGITKTDGFGHFEIKDTTGFSWPMSLFFKNRSGTTCGGYPITVLSTNPDRGFVRLNYYPVDLPCSCSKLINPP